MESRPARSLLLGALRAFWANLQALGFVKDDQGSMLQCPRHLPQDEYLNLLAQGFYDTFYPIGTTHSKLDATSY